MSKKIAIPELETPRQRQPELKRPTRPEPEIPQVSKTEDEVLAKDDQADSGPDKDNPLTRSQTATRDTHAEPDPEDAHIGAREDQVSETQAPAGEAYKDEPKQG